jgi:hypothetical protein
MFKVIVGVLVAAGIALGAIYLFGGYGSFDPTKQGRKAKAAIHEGMTWEQVLAAAGTPGSYRIMIKTTKKSGADKIETIEPGPPMKFDKALVSNTIASESAAHGFMFVYQFSHQAAFSVTFDSKGVVESVQDVKTMADLLDTRGP